MKPWEKCLDNANRLYWRAHMLEQHSGGETKDSRAIFAVANVEVALTRYYSVNASLLETEPAGPITNGENDHA